MTSFIGLCIVVALAGVAWNFYWARFEHRLRAEPPERAWLKLSLGRGMRESERKMLRVLRVLARDMRADSKQRRSGERQLRFVAVAEREHPDSQPVVRTYIACDPQMVESVSGALREQFGAKLGIQRVADPLAAFRPPASPAGNVTP